jgi:hypothetical protein
MKCEAYFIGVKYLVRDKRSEFTRDQPFNLINSSSFSPLFFYQSTQSTNNLNQLLFALSYQLSALFRLAPCALPAESIKDSMGARFEKITTETLGRSRKMKLLRRYFLFSAAGGLMFLCNSVINPWLKNCSIHHGKARKLTEIIKV